MRPRGRVCVIHVFSEFSEILQGYSLWIFFDTFKILQFQRKYPKTPLFVFSKRGPLYFSRKMAEKSKETSKIC